MMILSKMKLLMADTSNTRQEITLTCSRVYYHHNYLQGNLAEILDYQKVTLAEE